MDAEDAIQPPCHPSWQEGVAIFPEVAYGARGHQELDVLLSTGSKASQAVELGRQHGFGMWPLTAYIDETADLSFMQRAEQKPRVLVHMRGHGVAYYLSFTTGGRYDKFVGGVRCEVNTLGTVVGEPVTVTSWSSWRREVANYPNVTLTLETAIHRLTSALAPVDPLADELPLTDYEAKDLASWAAEVNQKRMDLLAALDRHPEFRDQR